MKNETDEHVELDLHLSPETGALVHGLGDSPESLMLKSEILRAANQLKRGLHELPQMSSNVFPS